jgi:tetratricopeptide (TPR) repeat protein
VLSAAQSYLGFALRDEMPRNWPYVLIGFLTWVSWALLTPVIIWLTQRVPLQRGDRFARALGIHLAAALLLTFVHGAFWLGTSYWIGSVIEPGSYGRLPIARTLAITLFGRIVSGLVTYGAIVGVATAADAQRTANFLGRAAINALAIGAFEETLRLVDAALPLLSPDQTRERASVLASRGQALWGLGRIDDAKAAWRGAAERYEELGDKKAATQVHRRLAHLETRSDGHQTNGAGRIEVAEVTAPAPEPELAPSS